MLRLLASDLMQREDLRLTTGTSDTAAGCASLESRAAGALRPAEESGPSLV
jgi:hypothetical protein